MSCSYRKFYLSFFHTVIDFLLSNLILYFPSIHVYCVSFGSDEKNWSMLIPLFLEGNAKKPYFIAILQNCAILTDIQNSRQI